MSTILVRVSQGLSVILVLKEFVEKRGIWYFVKLNVKGTAWKWASHDPGLLLVSWTWQWQGSLMRLGDDWRRTERNWARNTTSGTSELNVENGGYLRSTETFSIRSHLHTGAKWCADIVLIQALNILHDEGPRNRSLDLSKDLHQTHHISKVFSHTQNPCPLKASLDLKSGLHSKRYKYIMVSRRVVSWIKKKINPPFWSHLQPNLLPGL